MFLIRSLSDGPLLTLEHTGVVLASAVCLREGSCGTYAAVPVLLPGSLTKCLNWGNLFHDSCQVNLLNWWAPSDSRTHLCGSSICCVSPWGLTMVPMLRCRFCLVAWLNACWGNFFHVSCQVNLLSIYWSFFLVSNKSLNQRLYKLTWLAVKDLIDCEWNPSKPKFGSKVSWLILSWMYIQYLKSLTK